MTATLAAKLYLSINALLLVSYFVFQALSRGVGLTRIKVSHRHLITASQLLIALSIVAPISFHAIPTQSLPTVNWKAFYPASESDGAQPSKAPRARTSHHTFTPKPAAAKTQPSLLAQALHWLRSDSSATAARFFLLFILTGFFFSLIRLAKSARALRAVVHSATPVRAIGRVRVVVSDAIAIPFSTRLSRLSWVVLPLRMLENGRDFRIALQHELQHHRHGDTVWAVWVEFWVCVFFLNPAAYLWKREITELQEFSCDEALLGHKRISSHDYGSCLVRVAEAALGVRQMHAGTTCMAAGSGNPFYAKSFLRRRVEMFQIHESPRKARRWAGVVVGAVATVLTAAIAFGAEQSLREATPLKPVNPGMITVDPVIQEIAQNALESALKEQKAKSGFAIVADPMTGKILAVANIDTTQKLTGHWALGMLLEPASLAKTFVAAQAIESGLTTPQSSHSCENGDYRFADRVYHDWKIGGWDHLTTEETVAFSGDICSIKIGEKIGAEGLRKMLVGFGFGPEGTARSFPEARVGVISSLDNVDFPDFVPAVSVGFGYRATPIELIQAYGAIANGGNLLAPKLATESDTQVLRRVLSVENAKKMRGILQQVVLKGTAKEHAASALYTTAGKTATSYVPDLTEMNLVSGKKKGNFAGFIGFAPVEAPRVEVYVGIRDPEYGKTGAHGSTNAGPVFKRIVEEVLKRWSGGLP